MAVSWAVIVVAVAALMALQLGGSSERRDPDRATARAMLALQSRALVAAESLSEGALETQRPALEALAVTPDMTRRVAIVLAAVGGADGAGHAERLLGRTDGTGRDDPDSELGDLVRRAVEDPAALDPGDRQALEVEFGWPASWLMASTSAPDDPRRQALRAEAFRTLLALVALLLGGVLAFSAGLILLGTGIVLRWRGRLPSRWRIPQTDERIYLEAFAVYVASFVLVGAALSWTGLDHLAFRIAAVSASVILVHAGSFVRPPTDCSATSP